MAPGRVPAVDVVAALGPPGVRAEDRFPRAHAAVSTALDRLKAGTFEPGVKLTLLMRLPGSPDCYAVWSDEADLADPADVLRREIERAL